MFALAIVYDYSLAAFARYANRYHKSAFGDSEKMNWSNSCSKKCSSGYQKDENADRCKKSQRWEKTLTQIKRIVKSDGNLQDQTDVSTPV